MRSNKQIEKEQFKFFIIAVLLCVFSYQRSSFWNPSRTIASWVLAMFRSLASRMTRCMRRPWRPWTLWASLRRRGLVTEICQGGLKLCWMPQPFLLKVLICMFQISWRFAPQLCSWETLSSRKRGIRSRPLCPTILVRQKVTFSKFADLIVDFEKILETCPPFSSGPEGVPPAGHQCDRLHPCNPHPSNQSGQGGGAEGTDQRAGSTKRALLNPENNKWHGF